MIGVTHLVASNPRTQFAMHNHIALFVIMHPSSFPKQTTLLDHLRQGARDYYRRPASHCVAWSYLTPHQSSKNRQNNNEPVIAGLEIYTSKSALQEQLEDETFFQPFERMVVEKKMYAREGTMEAWYLTAGFVTRCQGREEGGGKVVVNVRKLTCVGGEKDAVVKGLNEFADWSRGSDPGVITFAGFTRKKAEREVLVYIRYRDKTTMRRVEERPEYQNFW
jgi:quinol monooxygenase YgiN